MPSRLSIFSSRLFGSALIWALLAAILVEWRFQHLLPARHPSHEVDQLLYDLDHGRIPARDTVFLGDSVGRQIARGLLDKKDGSFIPLASNAAIETPGQYYVLRRYLEHHARPKRVILMMGHPVEGQLRGDFTENYVQRGFLRWREIAELTWARRSLSFGLVMAGYKLSPTFRHRLAFQKEVSLLETPNPYSGRFDVAAPSAAPSATTPHGLLEVIDAWRKSHCGGPQIAETYFLRLATLLEALGIEWVYLPLPVPESASNRVALDGAQGRQVRRVRELSASFTRLRMSEELPTYPDAWFADGVHLREANLPRVAEEYDRILASVGFRR